MTMPDLLTWLKANWRQDTAQTKGLCRCYIRREEVVWSHRFMTCLPAVPSYQPSRSKK